VSALPLSRTETPRASTACATGYAKRANAIHCGVLKLRRRTGPGAQGEVGARLRYAPECVAVQRERRPIPMWGGRRQHGVYALTSPPVTLAGLVAGGLAEASPDRGHARETAQRQPLRFGYGSPRHVGLLGRCSLTLR
jgi:hypothetical protein